ncbi:hypothetical protein GCM10009837_06730 [Streptomyces durmitorensis]|uniref:Uncharacterized protein n=1 Tax=Streptomyces durmitorensis TaxID=319947 RepID=A0ABY4PLE2_9ACTN|nr:hypothetical protein [Streptomyces durmitorensis]UQT54431.1 hypothetical protein M4V62_04615 [Streptomyces durmitorensis]
MELSNLTKLASDEAVLKALADAVAARLRAVRTDMQEALDATGGVRQVAATLPDGTEVAKISLTDPKAEAVVTDPDAFRDWVVKNAPSEISRRVVTEVRDSYKALLLNQMTAAGRPEICDTETGVLETVPGVEVRATRARSHSVRFAKAGKDAIGKAWRNGELAADLMPQLDAGDGDAA